MVGERKICDSQKGVYKVLINPTHVLGFANARKVVSRVSVFLAITRGSSPRAGLTLSLEHEAVRVRYIAFPPPDGNTTRNEFAPTYIVAFVMQVVRLLDIRK